MKNNSHNGRNARYIEHPAHYNQRRIFLGIIIVLAVAGLIGEGLYYYLPRQMEVPKITEKPSEETIKPKEEIAGVTLPPAAEIAPEEKTDEERSKELSPPQVYISSERLRQGDTLLIRVNNQPSINQVSGRLGERKIDFLKSAGDWLGIAGIDAREKPGKYNLIIAFIDGNKFEKELEIVERKFPVTELLVTETLREKGYTPSKIAENVVSRENLIIGEILDIYTPKVYFSKAFTYPLGEIKVVGDFGNIRKSGDVALQHLGVDLEADELTPVYAINDGVVRFSEELTTYGKTLIIDHGLGIFSLYLHLNEFKVLSGEEVKRGDIIAPSGNTGYSIAPHLHFSVKANDASVDPLRFIDTIEKEMIK